MEAGDNSNKTDLKLNTLLMNIRTIQEDKNVLESKLSQKDAVCQAQMEALQHKTSEVEHLRERVTTLELTVSSETEEKSQYEVKFYYYL